MAETARTRIPSPVAQDGEPARVQGVVHRLDHEVAELRVDLEPSDQLEGWIPLAPFPVDVERARRGPSNVTRRVGLAAAAEERCGERMELEAAVACVHQAEPEGV